MKPKDKNLFDLYNVQLERIGRSERTTKNYLSNLKLFFEWYGSTFKPKRDCFTRVKEIDLLAYRSHLQYEKRHKTATVNQHVATLRSFYTFLYAEGIVKESVVEHLKPLSKPFLRAPEVPERNQILKLFRMVDTSNDRGKRDFAILQLFVQCGLRLFEVTNIDLKDIELHERKGYLLIVGGKGNQPREVPLNNTVRLALQSYLKVRLNLPNISKLFLSQLGQPLSVRSIHHLTKKYLEMAGMPDFSCHDLRHFFATELYNRHKDIILVKEALGHRTLESTLRYTHKTKDEIAEAMEDNALNLYRKD